MAAPVKNGQTGKWFHDRSGVVISILCGHKKIDRRSHPQYASPHEYCMQCPHCTRPYQRKTAFDKHVACCSILSSSAKERESFGQDLAETPPLTEVYKLVQRLVINEARMQKRIERLENQLSRSIKRKQDVLGWLNQSAHPTQSFTQWARSLTLTRADLECIFVSDYVEGLYQVIRRVTENVVCAPFRCFAHQQNAFYLYEQDDADTIEWKKADNAAMTTFIDTVHHKVIEQFKRWQDEQGDNIYTDKGSRTYHTNVRRVMGGTLPRDVSHTRLRTKMYNVWKTDTRETLI